MGMILLAGIVVKNSILLIDFIEMAKEQGLSTFDALRESVRVRTRPILMTAFGTAVGMIPIAMEWAIGLERLSPLAVVAIGGLMVSTFLTLLYVPIFYTLFEDLTGWTKQAFLSMRYPAARGRSEGGNVMNAATKELVAIAAAVAGKCQPCFVYHYKQAREQGVGEDLIHEAVQLAKDIRASGDKHMDEFTERRMEESDRNKGETT